MRLAESEHRVMRLIWAHEGITARELADALKESVGWSKTTVYTVISRCMEKNYIRREEPKFQCFSRISRQQVTDWETDALIASVYDDRPDLLVSALLSRKKLSSEQMAALYQQLEQLKEK